MNSLLLCAAIALVVFFAKESILDIHLLLKPPLEGILILLDPVGNFSDIEVARARKDGEDTSVNSITVSSLPVFRHGHVVTVRKRPSDNNGYVQRGNHLFSDGVWRIDEYIIHILATQDTQYSFIQIHDWQVDSASLVHKRISMNSNNQIVTKLKMT